MNDPGHDFRARRDYLGTTERGDGIIVTAHPDPGIRRISVEVNHWGDPGDAISLTADEARELSQLLATAADHIRGT